MKEFKFILLSIFLSILFSSVIHAKTAIDFANFGITVPKTIKSIDNITSRVETAFPGTEVRVVFTSNIIRSIWKKRSKHQKKWLDKDISKEIFYTKNLLSIFGGLKSLEFKDVTAQPTHLFHMEQYHNLRQYVNTIRPNKTTKDKWKPFNKIALGRPVLGANGDLYPFHEFSWKSTLTKPGYIDLL